MGFFGFLNHWWNLPFLILLGLTGVFFVLSLLGALGHEDADAEIDAEVDVDGDVDGDGDSDVDGSGHALLAFFGIGRVPFMVIWVPFFLVTGFVGLFVNRWLWLSLRGAMGVGTFFLVLGGALIAGLAAVRVTARLAARLVDVGGKGSTAKHELAGHIGIVASALLDQQFGEVRVRDDRGNELLVHARVEPGEPTLPRGARVVLIEFQPDPGVFWVTASPEADVHSAQKGQGS